MPRKRLPRVGELLVATVKEVFDYGAYVTLDEYNDMEAYLPWSEVASKWVKNIRSVVREGQKIVVKVIRVDRKRGQVDVSLKRVFESEKRQKWLLYKRAKKGEKLLELTAEKLGKKDEMDYIAEKLEKAFGDVLGGFEEALMYGPQVLIKAGIPEDWAQAIYEEAKKHLKLKKVKLKALVTAQTYEPDGVDRIRRVLMHVYDFMKGDEIKTRVYTTGAPKYKVEVMAVDAKTAAKTLEEMEKKLKEEAKKENVTLTFQQIKE